MSLTKAWTTWNATDWRQNSDVTGATTGTDPLGPYIQFNKPAASGRCEARLLRGGNMRHMTQGVETLFTYTSRLHAMSALRWLVNFQQKTEADDTGSRTPTVSMDGEEGRWDGKLVLNARYGSGSVREATIMTLAQLQDIQDDPLDWLVHAKHGTSADCFLRVAWKPHGAAAWAGDVRLNGANVRSGDTGPLTLTVGLYGGDSVAGQFQRVYLGDLGPRLYTITSAADVIEAEQAIGVGVITPPPPPSGGGTGPTQAEYDALVAQVASLTTERDQAVTAASAAASQVSGLEGQLGAANASLTLALGEVSTIEGLAHNARVRLGG